MYLRSFVVGCEKLKKKRKAVNDEMAFNDCAMKTTRYKEMPFFLSSQLQMSSQEISFFYVNSSLKVENNK